MTVLLIFLNLAISWFNAWSVGRSWVETKMVGGFARFMAYMVAIMSAVGFTWSYVALLGLICHGFNLLPDKYVQGLFSLGYLVIIIPALGSGIAITIHSWSAFWKERSLTNGAIAGWNTFAQIHNLYEAASAIPEAFKSVSSLFDSDDDDDKSNKLALLVVLLVAVAVIGGILTTRAIILNSARNVAREYQQVR